MIGSAVRRRIHLSQRENGFTLVELVVAMMVIAVILLLLIAVQVQAGATIKDARMRQQATALGNESLEQMRAIPWVVLKRGMYSGFESAAGGDDYATGTALDVEDQEFTLRIAPSGAGDQQIASQAWMPLFSSTGSNKQSRLDPGLTGTVFTVRSYVTEPLDGSPDAIGLAVVVSWTDSRGATKVTVVSAPTYAALSCGSDSDRSPFVGACQARLTAGASTGSVSGSITAWNVDTNAPAGVPVIPGTSSYSFSVNTATTSATVESEQSTLATGSLRYGNAVKRGDPSLVPPPEDISTIGVFDLAASNDPDIPGAAPANPAPLDINPVANQEPETSMTADGTVTLHGRSDFRRPGDVTASAQVSCLTGIPAGQTCAYATLGNRTPDNNFEASSNFFLNMNGTTIRLMRRLNESGGNQDFAWAARFTSAAGTSAVGCTTLSGPGCAAAGASRNLGTFAFGTVIGGTWSGGNGSLVQLQNYSDSVKVERGKNQFDTLATVTRSGTLQYWNGSSMSSVGIDMDSNFTVNLGAATWVHPSNPDYSIEVLSGTVTVSLPEEPVVDNGDDSCITAECQVYASSGTVTVKYEILIKTPANPTGYAQLVSAVVNPVSATAIYKDAPPT